MEDIDRTYYKLKRKPLMEVLHKLRFEGRMNCYVNPNTFAPIAEVRQSVLESEGWSISDITGEVEFQFGYKVLLEEWMR